MTYCFRNGFRSRRLSGLAAMLLAAMIGASFAAAQDKAEGEPKQLSAQEKMNRRHPQAVRVGFLVGLPVLDGQDSTLGYIRAVARTPAGIVLVVPYRAWLGWAPTDWGRKTVAVPIETVAILARQVAALDFSRDDFAAAPAYLAQGTPLAAGETIRIAVTRR
jgi:hypothetical protein